MRSSLLTQLSEACKKLMDKTSRKRDRGLKDLRPLMRNKSLCRELSDPQWLLVADLVLKIVESPSKSKTEELRLFKDVLRQMFRNMNDLNVEKICARFWAKALDIMERTDTETKTLAETLDVVQLLCEKRRCPASQKQFKKIVHVLIAIAEESRGGSERHQVVLDLRSLRAVRLLVANHSSTTKVRYVLQDVMEFLEEWPSANNDIVINDTQLNREFVMACCVVLRRFSFASIRLTQCKNSLKWILRFWDFVSPESPSSDCIVEYFRLRIRNSTLCATSRSGSNNLTLNETDNLQGSLLRIAFGLATRAKHLTYEEKQSNTVANSTKNDLKTPSSSTSSSSSAKPSCCVEDHIARNAQLALYIVSHNRNNYRSQYQRIALASELFWIVHQETSNIILPIDSESSEETQLSINIKGIFAASSSPWTQVLEILENAAATAGSSTMDGGRRSPAPGRRSPAPNLEETTNSDATVLTGTDPSLRVSLSAMSSSLASRKRNSTIMSSRERLVLMAALRIVHAVLIRTSKLDDSFSETRQLHTHLNRFLSPSSKYDSDVRQWSARILTCLLSLETDTARLSLETDTARKNWDITYEETLLVLNSHRWTSSENASSYVEYSLSLVRLSGVFRSFLCADKIA